MVGKGEGEASQEKGVRLLRAFFCAMKGLISQKVSVLVIYLCITNHAQNWWHKTVPILLLLVFFFHSISITEDFRGGTGVKNLPANAGNVGLIPGRGRSPRVGNGNPLQCSCLEKSHGQRILVGYSPLSHRVGQTDSMHAHTQRN